MKNNRFKFIFLLFIIAEYTSCIIPKEARELKRSTKEWRNSPVVFEAYGDTPFSGIFITLHENGKFEHTSSGMLKSFECGSWTVNENTIELNYLGKNLEVIRKEKYLIDKNTNRLFHESQKDSIFLGLRIMINKL